MQKVACYAYNTSPIVKDLIYINITILQNYIYACIVVSYYRRYNWNFLTFNCDNH